MPLILQKILLVFAGVSVVLTGTLLILRYHLGNFESFDSIDRSALEIVQYCDLRNNSRYYSGKIVKVEAHLFGFRHGLYLYDTSCAEKGVSWLSDDSRTAISSFTHRREEVWNELKPIGFGGGPARFIAIGRYYVSIPFGRTDAIQDRTSHHFEIYETINLQVIEPGTK